MDKEAFARRAQSEIDRTKAEITQLEELTQPVGPENAIGRISRMDAINNKSVNEAALRSLKDKLQKIERAMERIDEPDFGVCVKCGKPIPEGRIMLMPGSTRCVNCA